MCQKQKKKKKPQNSAAYKMDLADFLDARGQLPEEAVFMMKVYFVGC